MRHQLWSILVHSSSILLEFYWRTYKHTCIDKKRTFHPNKHIMPVSMCLKILKLTILNGGWQNPGELDHIDRVYMKLFNDASNAYLLVCYGVFYSVQFLIYANKYAQISFYQVDESLSLFYTEDSLTYSIQKVQCLDLIHFSVIRFIDAQYYASIFE